jgi:hypothetical protein
MNRSTRRRSGPGWSRSSSRDAWCWASVILSDWAPALRSARQLCPASERGKGHIAHFTATSARGPLSPPGFRIWWMAGTSRSASRPVPPRRPSLRRPAKQQRDGLLLRLSPLARGSAILLRRVSLGVLCWVRVPSRASVPTRCRLRGRRYGLRLWGPSHDGRVPPQVDHRGLLPRRLLVRPGLAGQRGRFLFHKRSLGRGPDESALCLALSNGRIRRRGQGQWVAWRTRGGPDGDRR